LEHYELTKYIEGELSHAYSVGNPETDHLYDPNYDAGAVANKIMSEVRSYEMEKEKHSGWRNYATWRISLELFDDMDHFLDMWSFELEEGIQAYELSNMCESYVDGLMDAYVSDDSNLFADYAHAFLSDVDYHEIAESIISYARENNAYDINDEEAPDE
jgi:hypothetical protein